MVFLDYNNIVQMENAVEEKLKELSEIMKKGISTFSTGVVCAWRWERGEVESHYYCKRPT